MLGWHGQHAPAHWRGPAGLPAHRAVLGHEPRPAGRPRPGPSSRRTVTGGLAPALRARPAPRACTGPSALTGGRGARGRRGHRRDINGWRLARRPAPRRPETPPRRDPAGARQPGGRAEQRAQFGGRAGHAVAHVGHVGRGHDAHGAAGAAVAHPCLRRRAGTRGPRGSLGGRDAARAARAAPADCRCAAPPHVPGSCCSAASTGSSPSAPAHGIRTLAFERGTVESAAAARSWSRPADGTTWTWDLASTHRGPGERRQDAAQRAGHRPARLRRRAGGLGRQGRPADRDRAAQPGLGGQPRTRRRQRPAADRRSGRLRGFPARGSRSQLGSRSPARAARPGPGRDAPG